MRPLLLKNIFHPTGSPRSEAMLRRYLEGMGIKVLEKNRNKEELDRISAILKRSISPESKKIRFPVLLAHDSEYVYLLQSELRIGLLTYDSELSRAIRSSVEFSSMQQRVVTPIALASFMDLESLPDMDCKAYIRKLLPTGQGTIEDVVQTHYLSKALMDGHELSMHDVGKIMSTVMNSLAEAARKSALDIHAFADIPIESATHLLNYIDPKFIELARELDRKRS